MARPCSPSEPRMWSNGWKRQKRTAALHLITELPVCRMSAPNCRADLCLLRSGSHQRLFGTQGTGRICFAAYLAEGYADGLYERSGKMPASLQAAENADNGALMIFADEYADSVSLPKMLETGNFWMQLEVLFSKVWNGDDVTTLVQQLDETIAGQVGGTEK